MRGFESAMEKYPEYNEPYYSEKYITDFKESLYLEKGVLEPLVRNRLGSWGDEFATKVRAAAKKYGRENEILLYIRRGLAVSLREYLGFKYMARIEAEGKIFDRNYSEDDDTDENNPCRIRCEENRLWLADAYQEASEICERASAIERWKSIVH